MGHTNIDTAAAQGQAHIAASELFQAANGFFQQHTANKEVNGRPVTQVETETGVRIERIEDALSVHVDSERKIGGVLCDVTTSIEWGWDIRDLPVVNESWVGEHGVGANGIPVHRFNKLFPTILAQIPTA